MSVYPVFLVTGMVLHNFQCHDALLIWMIVVQGPTKLAVGVGGVFVYFFSTYSLSLLSPLSLGDGLI